MSTFRSHQAKTVIRMDILPPDYSGRRTAEHAARTGRVTPPRGDVTDAQFVTVGEMGAHRRTSRPSHNDNRNATVQTVTNQSLPSHFFAMGERALMRLSADFFAAVVAAVFVGVFTLAGGFSFLFQGTQAQAEETVLDITHITMTPQDANGMKVLLINGIVENRSNGSLAMPSIRADLMSGEKVIATTLIAPPASSIDGGHSRGFSARVPHPGGKLPDLRLSLAEHGA